MKKALFLICAVALLPTAASAGIVGTWNSTVSNDYTIYTLNVAADAGETMWGFDVMVKSDSVDLEYESYTSSTGITTKTVFSPNAGYPISYFSLDSTALNSTIADVDTTYLKSAFAVLGDGAYGSGWSSLDLLQVAVLTNSGVTPADLKVSDATTGNLSGLVAIGSNPSNPSFAPIQFASQAVPEPGTLALLTCGLFGLLAFRRRNRR